MNVADAAWASVRNHLVGADEAGRCDPCPPSALTYGTLPAAALRSYIQGHRTLVKSGLGFRV